MLPNKTHLKTDLVVGHHQLVLEVERVREGLEEDVGGADDDVLGRIEERVLLLFPLVLVVSVQVLLVQFLKCSVF